MKKIIFLLLFLPVFASAQGTFTAPVGYNTGAPTAAPSGVGTRWRFDLLTGHKYTWNPNTMTWGRDSRGIDQVAGCSAPLYTPGYNQSVFAVNSCDPPELYQYHTSAWHCLNCFSDTPQTLSIDGNELTLSDGGGTVTLPGGADGNGIYDGSGTVPGGTIADTEGNFFTIGDVNDVLGAGSPTVLKFNNIGFFLGNDFAKMEFNGVDGEVLFGTPVTNDLYTAEGRQSAITGDGLWSVIDFRDVKKGIEYFDEYPNILTNDRSIPDVGAVNLLKQTPVSYTNAAAPNNTIFYSTTDSKLSYKDPAGVVHNLY